MIQKCRTGRVIYFITIRGLGYLMPLSTIFQLFRGGQFLLVEKTRVPIENHRPAASHWP